MDAELKAKLLEYLGTLEEAAKKGADFTAEQVPLAVQEYVTFAVTYHGMCLVAALLLGTAVPYACYRVLRWGFPLGPEEAGAPVAMALVFGAVSVVASFILFFGNLRPFLLAWLAPRVFIIEAVADLVK